MFFKKKMMKRNFSLIELLIVIGIMGALTALILPAFQDSESAAKDTACDYNQAGTLRYLQMFRSANGVYPTGFHTGGDDAGWTITGANKVVKLTTCSTHNFENASTTTALTPEMINSLKAAGIVSLAYGTEVAKAITGAGAEAISVKSVTASADKDTATWTEELDPLTGEVVSTGAPLTFRGVNIGWIAAAGAATDTTALTDEQLLFRTTDEDTFAVVPLYVAPTIDWEHYYKDGPNDSKVSISMTGKCPWGAGSGAANYYIAFFKVYTEPGTETAAKLLCTSCPDCGILEADAF